MRQTALLVCLLLGSVVAFAPPVHSGRRHDNTIVTLQATSWMDRARELYRFQQEHGHTNVPRKYPRIGLWVHKQRQQYRAGKLSKERTNVLRQLDFDRETTDDDDWWEVYHQLQQSHPSMATIPPQSRLGQWLHTQRSATLTIEQIHALDTIDPHWRWNRHQRVWEGRFAELRAYQQQYGDCCVPISFRDNPSLAHWVSNQRKQYNKGTLSKERKRRLDAIGFVWNRWEYEFARNEQEREKQRTHDI